MTGIYFSGTGNTKFCMETFLSEYDAKAFSIEEKEVERQIKEHEEIVLAYPVQYSNMPKMWKEFIDDYKNLWKDKKLFGSVKNRSGKMYRLWKMCRTLHDAKYYNKIGQSYGRKSMHHVLPLPECLPETGNNITWKSSSETRQFGILFVS